MKRVVALALLVGLAAAPAAAPREARNPRARVVGHAATRVGYSGDVVAHRGYAYLSSWHGGACPARGVFVYNLKNPRRPRHVSTFADGASEQTLRGTWTEKTIVRSVSTPGFRGELAVTSLQSCPGLNAFAGFALYDVTNPRAPRRLALVRTEPRGSHEIWLAALRRHAYVYTAIPFAEQAMPRRPGFRIFDVSNPRQPNQIGSWSAVEALHIRPNYGVGQQRASFVHSVRTNRAATLAFLSYWDLGTVILDIHNPARPRYLGRTHFRAGEEGNAHSTWLSANERLMIETHEWESGRPTLYDVSNPREPKRLATFHPPRRLLARARRSGAAGLELGVHDPKIVGKRAYFSWYRLGVIVADISRPRHPRFIAQFLPKPSADRERGFCPGSRCAVVWGVFPTRHYALASDMVGGLWVFRLR